MVNIYKFIKYKPKRLKCFILFVDQLRFGLFVIVVDGGIVKQNFAQRFNVTLGHLQGLKLGELLVGAECGQNGAQLFKCRVQIVHTISLPLIGDEPFLLILAVAAHLILNRSIHCHLPTACTTAAATQTSRRAVGLQKGAVGVAHQIVGCEQLLLFDIRCFELLKPDGYLEIFIRIRLLLSLCLMLLMIIVDLVSWIV